jgi:ABC-type phosphate transport system substrate-binding protein
MPGPRITRRSLAGALVCACGAAAATRWASAQEAPSFRVIVNVQNPLGSISRDFLSDVFLKRTTRWDGGDTIQPVDLRPDAAARRKFSEQVLKRSVAAVRSYWQQRIFSGRAVPPPELDSDQTVVDYVTRHQHAIGYVSGTARLGSTKELALR